MSSFVFIRSFSLTLPTMTALLVPSEGSARRGRLAKSHFADARRSLANIPSTSSCHPEQQQQSLHALNAFSQGQALTSAALVTADAIAFLFFCCCQAVQCSGASQNRSNIASSGVGCWVWDEFDRKSVPRPTSGHLDGGGTTDIDPAKLECQRIRNLLLPATQLPPQITYMHLFMPECSYNGIWFELHLLL